MKAVNTEINDSFLLSVHLQTKLEYLNWNVIKIFMLINGVFEDIF